MLLNKRLILIALSIILFQVANSQNLIVNGSFEESIECPTKKGSLGSSCKDFKTPTRGSTDYFMKCGDAALSVPKNFNGEQGAFEGEAYAGLYLYSPNNYREYIQFKLKEPLQKGKIYKASIRLSLAENSILAVQNVSVLFTQQKLDLDTNENLSPMRLNHFNINKFSYQKLEIKESIFNDKKWGLLEVEFKAKGYENHMVFGNFKNDRDTRIVRLKNKKNTSKPIAFYYIDDVSVVLDKSQQFMINTPFVLNKLQFKHDSFELTDIAKKDVQKVFSYLKRNPNRKIEIYGHADNSGKAMYNKYLSSRRARSVAMYLNKLGLPENRIVWEGKGDKKPILNLNTDEARKVNRRVEFVITEFEDKN